MTSCQFNATLGGIGDFVVLSATAAHFVPENGNVIDGKTYTYYAQSFDTSTPPIVTAWEAGSGPYTILTHTLKRTTITANSNGDLLPVNFPTPPIVDVYSSASLSLESVSIDSSNNIAINGGMEVDQEHAGAATTVASTYAIDNWVAAQNGTMVCTVQQVADAPAGFSNSLKLTVGTAEASIAAGDYVQIFQNIEGFRTSRLGYGAIGALPVTLSFWTKIHRTGSYSGSLVNSVGTRSYAFAFTQNVADTWEYKTVTIPGDVTGTWIGNTNLVGLGIRFAVASGTTFTGTANAWLASNTLGVTGTTNGVAATSDVFQITGVALLPGVMVPTAAQSVSLKRSFDQELQLCQRYFEKSYDYAAVPGTATNVGMVFATASATGSANEGCYVGFGVPKRTAPTMTLYSGLGGVGQFSSNYAGSNSINAVGVAGAAGQKGFSFANSTTGSIITGIHYKADARF